MSFDLAQLKARLPALAAAKGLPADLLPRAAQEARARSVGFCAALISLGVEEAVVLELMSAGTGLPFLRVLPTPAPGIGAGFDATRCRALGAVPISREDGRLVLACSDPLIATGPDLKTMPPHRLVLSTRAQVAAALERLFGQADRSPHANRTAPLKAMLADSLPAVIGGYRRLSMLGEGGMATVWQAEELTTGRMVALKVMLPHLARDKEFVDRFLQEAQAAQRLSHPHVVETYAAGEEDGALFIASEFMNRGTLEQLLQQTGPMPTPLALEIFRQALDGVAAAHAVGIIHRDLKPANLLLSSSGQVKVADFGIAKISGGAKLTQTGIVVGTPAYMSPEQASGGELTPASDLFAMGIILYELLSGSNPHNAASGTLAVMKVLSASVPPIIRQVPTVPPEVEAMLQRLLAKDRGQRAASTGECLPLVNRWLEPWRARGNLVASVLEHTKESCAVIATTEARRLYESARSLLAAGERRRAAFVLYRASLLAPEEAHIVAAFREVCASEQLFFGEAKNPKIHELEAAYATHPEAQGVLQQLANLYRLEGNAWRGAFYLRQYLRLRPTDGYAMSQLSVLTGEAPQLGAAPAAEARVPSPASPSGSSRSLRPVGAPRGQAGEGPVADNGPPSPQQDTGFVEYEQGDEATPMNALRQLWRAHGRLVMIGLGLLLVIGAVQAMTAFVDASMTRPPPLTNPLPTPTPTPTPAPTPTPTVPQDEGALLLEAATAYMGDNNNAADALTPLQEFMRSYPSHPRVDEARVLRAEAHLALGNLPNAEVDATEVVARTPPGSPLRMRAEAVLEQVRTRPAPVLQPPAPVTPEEGSPIEGDIPVPHGPGP